MPLLIHPCYLLRRRGKVGGGGGVGGGGWGQGSMEKGGDEGEKYQVTAGVEKKFYASFFTFARLAPHLQGRCRCFVHIWK